ncbi:MAG: YggS family pyridoxal phosphate-dependent enzyme [Thermoanaerobaculum sp.]|nr:YggS family pyridoxal phosphate-dependent enzyme [Thermoanaerobaculum sp.]
MSRVNQRLQQVRDRIAQACHRAGRSPEEVKVLAVTKTHPPEVVEEAIAAGVDAIGENRVQEAAEKKPRVRAKAAWHLVGSLQRNKALELFDLIATVDRPSLADTLERHLAPTGRRLPIMVEVNLGREVQKGGILEEELEPLLEHLFLRCPHLEPVGLLTIPPYHPDPEQSRPYFRRLGQLARTLAGRFGLASLQLSMGMSEDYWVAVEEGAHWVRLGRVLFGERQQVR